MEVIFSNMKDVISYTHDLIYELEQYDIDDSIQELKEWNSTFFSSSSEFLGELWIILTRLIKNPNLTKKVNNKIELGIQSLEAALYEV